MKSTVSNYDGCIIIPKPLSQSEIDLMNSLPLGNNSIGDLLYYEAESKLNSMADFELKYEDFYNVRNLPKYIKRSENKKGFVVRAFNGMDKEYVGSYYNISEAMQAQIDYCTKHKLKLF